MPDRRVVRVFDLDDTLTEPVEGSDEAFIRAHQEGFANRIGRSVAWLVERYAFWFEQFLARPDDFGWRVGLGDHIVCSPLADPFVLAQVTSQEILRADLGLKPADWKGALNDLYQANYLLRQSTWRPEMIEVFRGLRDRDEPFYVVTNSHPEKVRVRMESLGDDADWIFERLFGNAGKFLVTEGPSRVKATTRFPNLARDVQLRKQSYDDILKIIMERHEIDYDGFIVTGDNAELDLAMVVELGAQGRLMRRHNHHLVPYELAWAEQHERVRVVHNLHEAIAD